MKKIILCIAMTMYSLQFVAQINHQQSYFNLIGASVDNRGLCKSTANDGYMVVPDGAKRTLNPYFFSIMKVDHDFNVKWQKSYKDTLDVWERFYNEDLVLDTINQKYVVCGAEGRIGSYREYRKGYIAWFDTSGVFLSMKEYNGVKVLFSIAPTISSTNVKYIACGQTVDNQAIVMGLSETGNVQWSKVVSDHEVSNYQDVQFNLSGSQMNIESVYATGYYISKGSTIPILTKLNINGLIQFSKEYVNSESNVSIKNTALALGIKNNGVEPSIFLSGEITQGTRSHVSLIKVLNNGSLSYAKSYDVNQYFDYEFGSDIIKLNQQNELAIVGSSYHYNSVAGQYDTTSFLLRIDTNGVHVKTTIFEDFQMNHLYRVTRSDFSNSYILAGRFLDFSTPNYNKPLLIKAFDVVQEDCYSRTVTPEIENIELNVETVDHFNATIRIDSIFLVLDTISVTDSVICSNSGNRRVAGNSDAQSNLDITIRPSVSSSQIEILNPTEMQSFVVYSIEGKVVELDSSSEVGSSVLDISQLPKGVYVINFFSKTKSISKKFVKI
jgi:hypothetical protein